jgi:hypothetical protein
MADTKLIDRRTQCQRIREEETAVSHSARVLMIGRRPSLVVVDTVEEVIGAVEVIEAMVVGALAPTLMVVVEATCHPRMEVVENAIEPVKVFDRSMDDRATTRSDARSILGVKSPLRLSGAS